MRSPEEFENKKPPLFMNNYAVGELRLCVDSKLQRVFGDSEEKAEFLKEAWNKIKTVLNEWSKERYGKDLFKGYADGQTIRVQTGLHDLSTEDRQKIEEVMNQFNEGII